MREFNSSVQPLRTASHYCTVPHPQSAYHHQQHHALHNEGHERFQAAPMHAPTSAAGGINDSGWVQVRVVNGSDDTVWWKVACRPDTETVGQLRHRLIKGAGSFAPHLFHDGKQLLDTVALRDAGITPLSILSTGNGASLVYGKKAAASVRAAKQKGMEVVADGKPQWSFAQPNEQLWQLPDERTTAGRAHLMSSSHPDKRRLGHASDGRHASPSAVLRTISADSNGRHCRRTYSSGTSSSSGSSNSSSDVDHKHRHDHHRSHHRGRHTKQRSHRHDPSPTLIMPVAVCRCHADPLLYPVHVGADSRDNKNITATAARPMRLTNGGRGSAGKSVGLPPRDRAAAVRNGHERVLDDRGNRAANGAAADARSTSRGRVAANRTTVSEVLDQILPAAAKSVRCIGLHKDEAARIGSARTAEGLRERIEQLELEKQALQQRLGQYTLRAPDRTGLRTPAFPIEGKADRMFDSTCGDPGAMALRSSASNGLASMRPGGLGAMTSAYGTGANPHTMPHYLHHGVPAGLHPYAGASEWITAMPPDLKASLGPTITPTIAAPGLLKVSAPLYPCHAPNMPMPL